GASPVEDRHEVVAEHADPQFAHVPDALAVVVDPAISRGEPELDLLVHRNALHHGELQSRRPDLLLQAGEGGLRPDLAYRYVVERRHDPGYPGDLANMLQRYGVVDAIPAEGHVHVERSRLVRSPRLRSSGCRAGGPSRGTRSRGPDRARDSARRSGRRWPRRPPGGCAPLPGPRDRWLPRPNRTPRRRHLRAG